MLGPKTFAIWVQVLGLIHVAACSSLAQAGETSLGKVEPYAAFVGGTFELEAPIGIYEVYAYSDKRRILKHTTLVPDPGIAGFEITYRGHLTPGTKLRVDGAYRSGWGPWATSYFTVTVLDGRQPLSGEVRIELFRGNGSPRRGLDTSLYRRLE